MEEKHYKAFISYSHKDEKFGKWLHKALEKYKIPKELRKDYPSLPKSLFPIFRDREELHTSSNLGVEILKGLKNSKYLIVICSIDSAKSKWVNQEIIDFKKIHGEDKVRALILDGEPHAKDNDNFSDDLECFPEALKYKVIDGKLSNIPTEPIAGDFRKGKDGKELGKLKLLAGLLEVNFDDLNRREEKRKRRNYTFGISGLVILLLTVSILFMNTFIAEKLARSNFLTAQSYNKMSDDKTLALRLAQSACKIQKTPYCKNAIIKSSTLSFHYSEHDFKSPIQMANISSDDKNIIILLKNGTVYLLNEDEDKPIVIFTAKDSNSTVTSVSFTHDNNISFLSNNILYITNLIGKVLKKISVSDSISAYSVSHSPTEEKFVTGAFPATIYDYDGEIIASLEYNETHYTEKSYFSKDGKHIVTLDRGRKAILWNSKGQKIDVFKGHQDRLISAEFSKDNKWIVFGTQNSRSLVWDLKDMERSFGLTAQGIVYSATVSPKRKYVAYSYNNLIKFHTLNGQNTIASPLPTKDFIAHKKRITHVQFSNKGDFFISTSMDGILKIWHIKDFNPSSVYQTKFSAFMGLTDLKPIIINSEKKEFIIYNEEKNIIIKNITDMNNQNIFNLKESKIHFLGTNYSKNKIIMIEERKENNIYISTYTIKDSSLVKEKEVELNELKNEGIDYKNISVDYIKKKFIISLEKIPKNHIKFIDDIEFLIAKKIIHSPLLGLIKLDKKGNLKIKNKNLLSNISNIEYNYKSNNLICSTISGKIIKFSLDDLQTKTIIETDKDILSMDISNKSKLIVVGTKDGHLLLLDKLKENIAKIKMPYYRSSLLDMFRLPADSMQNSVYFVHFVENENKIITLSGDGILRVWNINIDNIEKIFNEKLSFGKIKK